MRDCVLCDIRAHRNALAKALIVLRVNADQLGRDERAL
jgi:hypothetical protein